MTRDSIMCTMVQVATLLAFFGSVALAGWRGAVCFMLGIGAVMLTAWLAERENERDRRQMEPDAPAP
jgi:hypothetical protein